MQKNPLVRLHELGQSVWLDLLSRTLLQTGQLRELITNDAVTGLTSNPAIFEKAIVGSDAYDTQIQEIARQGASVSEIYEQLAIQDIQDAADLLRPVYDQTSGLDGYVSLEVSPLLANDTQGTIDEARRLHKAVDRPNLMIKIPGTLAGLPAITQVIADGISVNVTLLFSVQRYRAAAEAYISGLEQRAAGGKDISKIRSVASFFLSRIDVMIDPLLDTSEEARAVRGKVAIANSRVAYESYKELFFGDRFRKLEAKGARKQWLLWASTSTKTKGYSDVMYVEPLIGPETVNTMPLETLEAYRDHGEPAARLEDDYKGAHAVLDALPKFGVDLDQITLKLEEEGIDKFVKPFHKLIQSLEEKTTALQSA